MTAHKSKVLLLGLGNDILSDDGVGLHVVRAIRKRLNGWEGIDVIDTCEMGLSLLDMIVDYECLVLVDAVKTGGVPPGAIREITLDDMTILPLMAPHFFGIGEIMAMGRQLGMNMPGCVRIFAIEAGDPFTVSTQMTNPLANNLPFLAQTVMEAALALANASGEGFGQSKPADQPRTVV